MRTDLTLPHRYTVETTADLPGAPEPGNVLYFPGARKDGGAGGALIRMLPAAGAPWIGIFVGGYRSPHAVTGVFSSPSPDSVCVVSSGRGYVVRTDAPETWEEVDVFPITDVRCLAEPPRLIFASFTVLSAWGPEGRVWRTGEMSWDGIEIAEVTPRALRGTAWDAASGTRVEFLIDPLTGVLKCGGSSRPDERPANPEPRGRGSRRSA